MSNSQTDTGAESSPTESGEHVECLVVFVDGERYAFELGRVMQIEDGVDVVRVPRSARAVRGVTSIRGDLTVVVDARELLASDDEDADSQEAVADSQLVMLDRGPDAEQLGVLVDGIDEIQVFDVTRFVPVTDEDPSQPFRASIGPAQPDDDRAESDLLGLFDVASIVDAVSAR